MPKRHTQEDFISEARAKHGNFYGYSKVCYVKSNLKVIVICPTHDDFEITPSHHLNSVLSADPPYWDTLALLENCNPAA